MCLLGYLSWSTYLYNSIALGVGRAQVCVHVLMGVDKLKNNRLTSLFFTGSQVVPEMGGDRG